MKIGIAINGFGRIGRAVVRNACKRRDFAIVAINDLMSIEMMAYLLRYDSVHGNFDEEVHIVDDSTLQIGKHRVAVTHAADPAAIEAPQADVAIESTGKFLRSDLAKGHLRYAKKVIISAPATDETPTFVYGVNHTDYASQSIISNASCTTNCLAPIAKLVEERYGIESGLMTTVHSYTIDQNLLDSDHKRDIRRARAAAVNLVPTTTGAARAIFKVLPSLKNKLDGRSVRVPVADVSLMDLDLVLEEEASTDELVALFKEAAATSMQGVLAVDEEYRVSSDFLGSSYSSIVAADLVQAVGRSVKIMSWYDNEWGYANRLLDMAKYITKE